MMKRRFFRFCPEAAASVAACEALDLLSQRRLSAALRSLIERSFKVLRTQIAQFGMPADSIVIAFDITMIGVAQGSESKRILESRDILALSRINVEVFIHDR